MISNSDIAELITWRRQLHRRPEISGAEEETAKAVVTALEATGPDRIVTGLGGHGVAAIYRCDAESAPTLMLRCELDGLPIEEINTFDHRSETPGHGHLCGHDGHMAIMMGVARQLGRFRRRGLNVMLLFQPAEETGAGARAVLEDARFDTLQPDFAASLHNMPGHPLGHVTLAEGTVNCASRGMRIGLGGKTAHASQPETGVSPALAMVEIIAGLQALNRGLPEDGEAFRMATVTHAGLGEQTFGVAPGDGEIWVTLRTLTDAAMAEIVSSAETLAQDAADRGGLTLEIAYDDIFTASVNDPLMTGLIAEGLEEVGIVYSDADLPQRWSEDFGRFGADAKAAMFFLGSGVECPALHNPDYDFPDDLISVGVRAFLAIITRVEAHVTDSP